MSSSLKWYSDLTSINSVKTYKVNVLLGNRLFFMDNHCETTVRTVIKNLWIVWTSHGFAFLSVVFQDLRKIYDY